MRIFRNKIFLKWVHGIAFVAILSILFAFVTIGAKKFSIKPGTLISVEAKPGIINNYEAKMVNESNGAIEIEWKLLENTLIKGWDYSICNYGKCLAGIPYSGKMKTINKDESGFINLHVNPFKIKGTGKVSFYVYESGNEKNGDTLTYFVTAK